MVYEVIFSDSNCRLSLSSWQADLGVLVSKNYILLNKATKATTMTTEVPIALMSSCWSLTSASRYPWSVVALAQETICADKKCELVHFETSGVKITAWSVK